MNKNIFAAVSALSVESIVAFAGPAAAGPVGLMDQNGIYIVGADIHPGIYTSTGPSSKYGCYWERLSGTSGDFDDIIANDFVDSGRMQVTIKPTDYAFNTEDCGTWTMVPPRPGTGSSGS